MHVIHINVKRKYALCSYFSPQEFRARSLNFATALILLLFWSRFEQGRGGYPKRRRQAFEVLLRVLQQATLQFGQVPLVHPRLGSQLYHGHAPLLSPGADMGRPKRGHHDQYSTQFCADALRLSKSGLRMKVHDNRQSPAAKIWSGTSTDLQLQQHRG
jgi:hypothetical protein